jgi:hypothetical protein
MNRIRIMRQDETLAVTAAENETLLVYQGSYQPGDAIVFDSSSRRVLVSIDHTVPPARLYLPEKSFMFRLPLEGDLPQGYPPFAFQGEYHLLSILEDTENEIRNLASNPADQRHDSGAYPHASANAETRNESVFFARNAIDGLHAAASHGRWPWLSWGIWERPDAAIRLDFGRPVTVDSMALYLRADFEKSGYWVGATVHLSDGFKKSFPLLGIDGPQTVTLDGPHTVTWMRLDQLVKNDPDKKYPALRQWEVYGRDAQAK